MIAITCSNNPCNDVDDVFISSAACGNDIEPRCSIPIISVDPCSVQKSLYLETTTIFVSMCLFPNNYVLNFGHISFCDDCKFYSIVNITNIIIISFNLFT